MCLFTGKLQKLLNVNVLLHVDVDFQENNVIGGAFLLKLKLNSAWNT